MEDSSFSYTAPQQRLLVRLPATRLVLLPFAPPPRSSQNLPEEPRTCPQDLSLRKRLRGPENPPVPLVYVVRKRRCTQVNRVPSRRLHLASKVIFGPDIWLLMVRAVADVTVESAPLVGREAQSRNARSRRNVIAFLHSADRDDEPLLVRYGRRYKITTLPMRSPTSCLRLLRKLPCKEFGARVSR